MEQVLRCIPYSVAGLYDRSMTEQSARILIIVASSSPHQRSWAQHAVVISAPCAGDMSLSGGTVESLPDTIEHSRADKDQAGTKDGEHTASVAAHGR